MAEVKLNEIGSFNIDNSYLNIVRREKPKKSNKFFKELVTKAFNIDIQIYKKSILENIQDELNKVILNKLINDPFYHIWIQDMAKICAIYFDLLKTNTIRFSLVTSRGCKRYHIDNVPIRLLVTYFGKGTEWLPSEACDYSAYYNGESNKKIIINKAKKKFIDTWNIAIFKGQKFRDGGKGILHRTPDNAINGKSLLMRLDRYT